MSEKIETMEASVVTLHELYDDNRAYVIPGYQRPFAWSEDKVKDLLESISADAIDSNTTTTTTTTTLGTLLFHPLETGQYNPYGIKGQKSNAIREIWEVIDGQQRLTTLALIGHCLNNKFEEFKDTNIPFYNNESGFKRLYCAQRGSSYVLQPRLIRDEDNFDNGFHSEIAQLLDHFIKNPKKPYGQTKGNISATNAAIEDWVDVNLNKENFINFCKHFLNKCRFIQVVAYDEDEAFTLFETLNSTSEPLTAFEVYKSKAIRKRIDFTFPETNKYLDYDLAKRDEITKKSNYLVFYHGQVWSGIRNKLHFVYLKKYLDDQFAEKSMVAMDKISIFMKNVWEEQDDSYSWLDEETIDHIRFLKASKHLGALPVLIRYFIEDQKLLPEIIKIICAFFILWRSILPTNKLPEVYRDLLDTTKPDNNMCVNGGKLKSPEMLANYFKAALLAQDNLTPLRHGHDTNAIIGHAKNLWINKATTELTYKDYPVICRFMVLLEIKTTFRKNLFPDDPWTKTDDIEHIRPQSTVSQDDVSDTIGNLTILPPSINRSIQDVEWKYRKEIYSSLSNNLKAGPPFVYKDEPERLYPVQVITFLEDSLSPALAYLKSLAEKDSWGKKEIEDRTALILDNAWSELFDKYLNRSR